MPEAELESTGAVRGCGCNACREFRGDTTPSLVNREALMMCGVCGGFYGEDVRCNCRACPLCFTMINAACEIICSSCRDTYPSCSHCGGVYAGVLQSCRCGRVGLCQQCIETHRACNNPVAIHAYSYKPTAQFAGDGPLYLGVELEVDKGRDGGRARNWDENPNGLLNPLGFLSKGNSLFYLKSDGSLRAGFELVTHPCSLLYHQTSFPWEEVLEELKETGLQSHNTETCGLHIHASRKGFGRTAKQQEMVLGRLIMLWHRHWWRYAQLSRRQTSELRWCVPNHEAAHVNEEDMVEMLEMVKKPGDRAVAINTMPWDQGDRNKETVEFRLFKGTLNHRSLMAALEIVHHSITLAKAWKFEKVVKSRWGEVVADAEERGYTHLVNYVKERGVE